MIQLDLILRLFSHNPKTAEIWIRLFVSIRWWIWYSQIIKLAFLNSVHMMQIMASCAVSYQLCPCLSNSFKSLCKTHRKCSHCLTAVCLFKSPGLQRVWHIIYGLAWAPVSLWFCPSLWLSRPVSLSVCACMYSTCSHTEECLINGTSGYWVSVARQRPPSTVYSD